MSGLLVDGRQIAVPGVEVLNRFDDPKYVLSGEDYRSRQHSHVSKFTLHTTKGIWPQIIRPGRGPEGRVASVRDAWKKDPVSSAAPIVVDGHRASCLEDLFGKCCFHATTVNDDSIGLEMYQESDGTVYEGTLENTVAIALAIVGLAADPELGRKVCIPFQIAGDAYHNDVIARLKPKSGAPDVAGIFGHRDQAWMFPEWIPEPERRAKYPQGYAARGRGDPGDEIYKRLIAAGAEPFNLGNGEDLRAWKFRQARLNLWGEKLVVDGIFGPNTNAAMRKLGFTHGREIDAAVEDPRG